MPIRRRSLKRHKGARIYHWTREETLANAREDGQATCVIDGKTIDVATGEEIEDEEVL